MTGLVFVDTNVLVYHRALSEPAKQAKAAAWLDHLWRTRTGRTSFQVLQEFYVTVTRKLQPSVDPQAARAEVRNLLAWRPVATTRRVIEAAWEIQDAFRLSFWDAMIVAAASTSDCTYLLTEDLQADQELDRLRIVNPFRSDPASLP